VQLVLIQSLEFHELLLVALVALVELSAQLDSVGEEEELLIHRDYVVEEVVELDEDYVEEGEEVLVLRQWDEFHGLVQPGQVELDYMGEQEAGWIEQDQKDVVVGPLRLADYTFEDHKLVANSQPPYLDFLLLWLHDIRFYRELFVLGLRPPKHCFLKRFQ